MYKLETLLQNFRFNRDVQNELYTIGWFKYDLAEDSVNRISGFEYQELEIFRDYAVRYVFNFVKGGKNYHIVDEGEVPAESDNDRIPSQGLLFPRLLLLKPCPKVCNCYEISKIMEIALVDKLGENIEYSLQFGAIGKIVK